MSRKSILYLTYTAVFAALVFVLTNFVKINFANGYYHIGDSFIYLAAVCLPYPYAALAGALGGALADLAGGFPIYILPTIIVKASMICLFSRRNAYIMCRRNILALLAAALITAGGYYIAEVILITHSFAASLVSVWGNLAQAGISAAVFAVLGVAFDKLRLRHRIFGFIWQCE